MSSNYNGSDSDDNKIVPELDEDYYAILNLSKDVSD